MIPLKHENHWFNNEVVAFSNWRNIKNVDYSTNAIVTQFYSGKQCKYLRGDNINEAMQRLFNYDTLYIGIDYYALFSQNIFSPAFIQKYGKDFLNGSVMRLKIYVSGNYVIEVMQ